MTVTIGRRELLAALGGAAAAWPLAARAQGAKRPTIGLLGGATASAQTQWTAAFVQRLRELGWVEGKTVAIEYRWVEGRFERSTRDHRRVRPTQGRCHCHACDPKRSGCEASDIGNPHRVRLGGRPSWQWLVTSLARPGANVTGLSVQSTDLVDKSVELLRDLLPKLGRVAILYHVGNPVTALQADAVKAVAGRFGVAVVIVEIRGAEDIAPAIEALEGRSDALIIPSEPLYNTNRAQINSSDSEGTSCRPSTSIGYMWIRAA